MENMNNSVIFILPNGEEIKELTEKEQSIFNQSNIKIEGNNNTIKMKISKREDIETILLNKGFIIFNYGNNNTINLGNICYHFNPILGIKGLNIIIGNDVDPFLDPGNKKYASNCNITIGDDTLFCGVTLYLQDDNTYISIGKKCMFSWGIDVWCTDAHTITDMDGNVTNYGKSIEIGDHVWVGKDCKIGKNTKISSDSIVAWNSVVNKKFDESNVIIAGNPATIVKRNINWDARDIQNYNLSRANG